jgi:Zn-dependent M16 (insulinase) family peptidase
MRAIVVDQVGPKVNGYFALATEIHDDSGAPHTLEHLCFMGSKSYQYKGLLDKLATRAYSTTNAWTAVEQTAYTLDTAGWDGFAQILPVYLEHVIVPTLTDAGCYTEVHHIDGTGQDAGVVYSEMQGVQNTQYELMELRARRLMYPEGNGFRYETGGMMEQLRVLTADRIRAFHKEMYQPKNLCLVLTGEVNHTELLQILDDFEDTIMDDIPSIDAPFERPWTDSKLKQPLSQTVVERVKFPEEDESMGEVLVGYIGPNCNDQIAGAAMGVMLTYLCGSSISVLENTLVEKEQLCSMVYYNTEYRTNLAVWFQLSAVETARLEEVEQRLINLLKETAAKPFDMDYLHDCITRWRRQIKMRCENAGDFFATPIIEDHLFGHRDGRDLKEMETIKELDILESWNEQQWRDYMKEWLSDAKHVSVLGEPSKELSEKITREEEARVKAQQERLGEEGLKRLADKLKEAQDENDKPIPDSLLEKFPVPSAESVHFISTTTARAGKARRMGELHNEFQDFVDKDDNGSPLFMHFEQIPSNFVRMKVTIGTSTVPLELKPLLTLYLMNFFTTPVMRDGKRIEFEDLVLQLEKETVGYGVSSESANHEMLYISFQTEPEYYSSVIGWLKTLLFDAIHDPERLLSSLTKILADIPDEKRSGDSMLSSVNRMINYERGSSVRARDTLSKSIYLKRSKKLLKSDPDAVIAQLSELCRSLHQPENFRIYVSADIKKLKNPVSSWQTLTSGFDTSKPLQPIDQRRSLLSDVGKNPGSVAYVVPMGTIDSSFASLTTKGPDDYDHPDLPALMVAKAYIDAVEGPLWVAVRGTGLAYGTSFARSVDVGLFIFSIYRSPDAFKAFSAAKEQVEGYASGKFEFDKFALEGAVSEIVLSMANEQPTFASAAATSYGNQVIRGIEKDWSHQMLSKVQAVKPEHIREVMKKYMVPAFQPHSSNLVITCAQIMKESLSERFSQIGYKPEVRTLESFQDDYGMQLPEGEDAEDEDDDEDDEFDDGDGPIDTPGSDEEHE